MNDWERRSYAIYGGFLKWGILMPKEESAGAADLHF
jgi:hypothetical protein